MKLTLHDRLLKRELGNQSRYPKIRGIYGDKQWLDDLDIVNELDGHSGCVNALSWSRSGRLLASGSDDTNINIHSYLPESSTSQFNLATTISTGHTANIFSVKFMPHTNDRTIVSAAGDATVRIFDIEYSGTSPIPSQNANGTSGVRSRGRRFRASEFLNPADTSGKVFRSHSDRVKRIVTESSPYFFLTCSEDGEVRQWDVRQPESAYPKPRGYGYGRASVEENVPPALISYKRYNIDLNTISCSPSQPHYIALGGNHLHCFIHDRRMLGRDKSLEMGVPPSSPSARSASDDDWMGRATRCVRRFAPSGQNRMGRTDSGHITACKISDANPNEVIVSWSGDFIYSFDIAQTPDARDLTASPSQNGNGTVNGKVNESKDRKRKRRKGDSSLSLEGAERAGSRARTDSDPPREGEEQISLMVQYENGQSEEIQIEPPRAHSPTTEAREADMPESHRQSYRIADVTVQMRKKMFTLSSQKPPSQNDPTGYAAAFSATVSLAASILPDMDDIVRTWRYPVNPLDIDVTFQNKLRSDRAKARRFVQASGTLCRVLGGKLRTAGTAPHPAQDLFEKVIPAPNESHNLDEREQFGYDFLKAILLWLDSGVGALVEGFSGRSSHPRFPIPEDASMDAIDDDLIPYLLRLAGDDPIFDLDTSPFETDERRVIFASEKAAVLAFAAAVKIPFQDLSSAVVPVSSPETGSSTTERFAAQDRRTALRYWAFKVGRGVLMNAGEDVNFNLVDNAFGGLGRPDKRILADEAMISRRLRRIDPDEEDVARSAVLVRRKATGRATGEEESQAGTSEQSGASRLTPPIVPSATVEDAPDDEGDTEVMEEDVFPVSEVFPAIEEARAAARAERANGNDDDNEEDDEDGDSGSEAEDSDSDSDSSTEDDDGPRGPFFFRGNFLRHRLKSRVHLDVPCMPHSRQYRGHCNVKTVKDVNFYGLQDEYVVSGSDSGHVFIWDRKTSQLVNILEGDGEVVNVVQGHPYEPLIAVSGIDHTIKIFSADARAREDARRGVGVTAADASTFSSINFGRMRRSPMARTPTRDTPNPEEGSEPAAARPMEDEDEGDVAPNGLTSRKRMYDEYRITSNNDADRRGNSRGDYISRSMLALLAERLREEMSEDTEGNGPGGAIVLDDDRCEVQ